MLISTRSRYGLRALAELALHDDDTPISLTRLAEKQHIPIRYLEQIFGKLRIAGIVKGKRGPGGGYTLADRAAEIKLLDVVQALETEFLPASCLSDGPDCGKMDKDSRKCIMEDTCVTRRLWIRMRDIYYALLSGNSLEDLANGGLKEVTG